MAAGRATLHAAVTDLWLGLQQQVWGPCSPARRRKDPAAATADAAVERTFEEVAPPAPEKPQFPADNTVITMTQLVLPSDASQEGSLLAGPLLKWIDICACMSAERFSGVYCVTAMMEDIHFLNKVHVGQVIVLTARVHQAWNTSMEVGVIVTIDRLSGKHIGKPILCCRARSTFVSKNKAELPLLTFGSEEQKNCGEEASARKAMRLKMPKKNDQEDRPAIVEGTTVSTELVMPHHCQHMGTTFGGWVMQWMESTASIAAARHTRLQMACVSTDSVHFLAPSHTGEAIEFRAVVTGVWNTSLEVGCWATAEDLRSGTSKLVCQMYATYVVSEKAPDKRTVPQLPAGTHSALQVTNAYQRRIARMQRRALESVGELSMDAAAFGDKAARSAVRDLEALAHSEGPSYAGPPTHSQGSSSATLGASNSSHQLSLSWEVLFNGPEHNLPVVVDALEGSTTCIRFSFVLGAPPERVHELVNDFEARKKWDTVIVNAEPLCSVPSDQSEDSSYKPGVPVKIDTLRLTLASHHEVIIARARMVDPAAGTFTSVSRSVKHPDAKEPEGSKRVEVLPSGWVLKSDGQGGCQSIYVLQLGSRALGAMLSSMKDGSMMSNADLTSALLKGKENRLDISGGMLPAAVKSVITLMGTLPPRKP